MKIYKVSGVLIATRDNPLKSFQYANAALTISRLLPAVNCLVIAQTVCWNYEIIWDTRRLQIISWNRVFGNWETDRFAFNFNLILRIQFFLSSPSALSMEIKLAIIKLSFPCNIRIKRIIWLARSRFCQLECLDLTRGDEILHRFPTNKWINRRDGNYWPSKRSPKEW